MVGAMKIFLTGGTGFVGSTLVPELLRAGHSVVGLARSDDAAAKLKASGATVHRGDLEDLDALRSGARAADAVIHAAFELDLSNWARGGEIDRRAIEALASPDRLLVVSSGAFAIDAEGIATEDDVALRGHPRVTETVAEEAASSGARVALLRLGVVHGDGDRHFLPRLIGVARERGASAYVGDGAQRWPMVHVRDAADAYRLAIEHGVSGARYHAVAEEGVSVRDVAAVIARKLGLPLVSQSAEEAAAHFGPFAPFVAASRPTSSARTREMLGWLPRQRGVLEDLEHGTYF